MGKNDSKPISSAKEDKLTKGELISYGLGGVGSTMPGQFKDSYIMNFMTDVAGLPIGPVGVLNTLLIIWDAINDPIIGGIADRTNTKRWGKYRPHMMMGILCWAVIMFLLFSIPDISQQGQWIYYTIMLLLYSVFFTQYSLPWQALNSAMTHDPKERNTMLAFRQYGGFLAGASVGIFTIPLVNSMSDKAQGWRIAVSIVCVIMVIAGLMAANGAKRRDYYNSLPMPKKVNVKEQLALILKNRAVICVALLFGVVTLFNTTGAAISLYYLRWVVGNQNLVAIFSLGSLVISLVVIPIMPAFLGKFGKIKCVAFGMIVIVVQSVWLALKRESASPMEIIAFTFIGSFGFVFANMAALAMVPDCTDYTEYKFGTVSAGFISACVSFMKKFCSSFSTLIVGIALSLVNYDPTVDTASQAVIDTIINVKIAYPVILCVLALALLKLYPITPKFAKEMRAELKLRRESHVQ